MGVLTRLVPDVSVTILVPCYNEELTIEACLQSWLQQSSPADKIIVLDDGSTDGTATLLQKYSERITVVSLKHKGNKSFVQEAGIPLVDTDVFIATDADTMLHKDFVNYVKLAFANPDVHVFSGSVQSLRHNWLTACREIDYTVGQTIHKEAQHRLGFVFVVPGCAGAFRTKTFKSVVQFQHDTITEDLDFSYRFNLKGYRTFYDQRAIAYTQDPATLRSYIGQMRRWYGGGFQNLRKYIKKIGKPNISLELSLMYIDGTASSFMLLVLPLLNISTLTTVCSILFASALLEGLYTAIVRKRIDPLFYSPYRVVVLYINAYIFLEQLFREFVIGSRESVWFTPERRAL